MNRHAYLIIAHTQPELLKDLLSLLDDERNDIYVHIDSKSVDFPVEEIRNYTKRSGCYLTERTNVVWGTYSQIHCEMILLKEAVQRKYTYSCQNPKS